MLVCWICDLNYVGTLVYAELVGRHYGDLDLHSGRAAGAGRRHPPRSVRKTLFTSHLWRPARYRQPAEPGHESTRHGAHPPVRGIGQSADQAISIGWLNVQSLRNKTDAVEELVRDRSLDVLALTEMWHTDSDDICLHLAMPEGYAIADVARPPGRAGAGVAIIFNKSLKCSRVPLPADGDCLIS